MPSRFVLCKVSNRPSAASSAGQGGRSGPLAFLHLHPTVYQGVWPGSIPGALSGRSWAIGAGATQVHACGLPRTPTTYQKVGK
jgi:hypothetical protein